MTSLRSALTSSLRAVLDRTRPHLSRASLVNRQKATGDELELSLVLYSGPVIGLVPRTPQAEEEDKILESYLMGMKIKEDQLTLPPVSERPDGFDLFYKRRSRRKIYEYEMDDEKFTLLISKYQEKTVDAAETEASDFDEIDTEVLFLFPKFTLQLQVVSSYK